MTFYIFYKVTRWRYRQGIGLAIHRSRVQVLAGHYRVVASGKLLTPVRLRHQAVHFGTGQGEVMFLGWEGS